MLVKMQTTPENCIFIDNSVQNLLTARELGMDTILFNRDGEEYDGKTVNSFNELAEVV
jgi:putative hydrolase of the HAD superfamily